ncbi:hypothetical protein T265_04348 [Opisthorchis viverrini]|uniref:Glycine cleavage system P protein n=2 Tax=Opisthorchis viverrini TaxID=6198 RepID=A0A074ZSR7_OPIVI|nr:hypothetical protein T265_04348 [Opisthorchis viverrini]KER28877.1 hypothetical protein T265_04348 [Opisthorchis viverrini]
MLLPRLTRILRLRWTGLAGLCRLTQTATSPTLETTKVHPESPIGNFQSRHIGPSDQDAADMLKFCGYRSMDELISKAIPDAVRLKRDLCLEEPMNEFDILKRLEKMMNKNQVWRSYIGQGYYGTITPTPIIRNIFENPGWYTSYTPYQPEISQGRLEALLNFQTVVSELTGLPVANASLLDEGTAAAEAISMAYRVTARSKVLVDSACHPQTIDVVRSRANGLDFEVQVLDFKDTMEVEKLLATDTFAACLMQYPDTEGNLHAEMVSKISEMARKHKTLSVVATDLLALTLVRSPGELGADVAIGSAQRFGVPMGFGGPHAAFFATRQEFVRAVPGRVVGISKDSHKRPALRLALQVREQHIRRDKATSNICTAQALLANMASFYAVYHGPQGLRDIASRVHRNTIRLAASLILAKYEICSDGPVFDTLKVRTLENLRNINTIKEQALQKRINLRYYPDEQSVGISLDQTVTDEDFMDILYVFDAPITTVEPASKHCLFSNPELLRKDEYLNHAVFNSYHSETELLRYMKQLENRDVSLTHSMIPLGSCTMKLNATTSMMPCSWPTVNSLHPFVPAEQTQGYEALIHDLEQDLAEVTGYDHVCLAPNSGAQGEYAGLCAIARFLKSRGEIQRKVCLIPTSAHGTNPASAKMAGMSVHPLFNTKAGGFDMAHLREQLDRFKNTVAAMMVTYPSTFGVFDEELLEACELVHNAGGQVYLDGANMNAQVGLCRPGDLGTDVCHLNLHKTFSIPHGGGGPGIGPICVKEHLAPFLPQHAWRNPCLNASHMLSTVDSSPHTVCSAPFGSASLLLIPWSYIKLLGPKGVRKASETAILNANYMLQRLRDHYPIKFVNKNGCCAHEFIVDCSSFEKHRIFTIDIAKRLIDYGFHGPTMSWPVPSSLMIEPTECESRAECDRLCDALILIKQEIEKVARGEWPIDCNPLKLAPHTVEDVTCDKWDRPYSRQEAAFPAPWHCVTKGLFDRRSKTWPTVGRIDDAYGDTHLCCAVPTGY